jgi:hypothetical protein
MMMIMLLPELTLSVLVTALSGVDRLEAMGVDGVLAGAHNSATCCRFPIDLWPSCLGAAFA